MKKLFLKIVQSRNILTLGIVGILIFVASSSILSNVALGADTQQGLYDYCVSSGIEYTGGCTQYASDLAGQGAQAPVAYSRGLVQCDEANPASCSLCALFATVKEVYNFASRLTLILAVAYILWGGYEIMISGAKPALYASGKKRITNAFLGVFIVLAAWFLVNAFIVGLTGTGTIYGYPWNDLQCQ